MSNYLKEERCGWLSLWTGDTFEYWLEQSESFILINFMNFYDDMGRE